MSIEKIILTYFFKNVGRKLPTYDKKISGTQFTTKRFVIEYNLSAADHFIPKIYEK